MSWERELGRGWVMTCDHPGCDAVASIRDGGHRWSMRREDDGWFTHWCPRHSVDVSEEAQ